MKIETLIVSSIKWENRLAVTFKVLKCIYLVSENISSPSRHKNNTQITVLSEWHVSLSERIHFKGQNLKTHKLKLEHKVIPTKILKMFSNYAGRRFFTLKNGL